MSKQVEQSRREKNQTDNSPITKFDGYYAFLSNDFPAWVCYEGMLFPSVNTAFQAARTDKVDIRKKLAEI